jgi:8-oxo-dGTP pyrophosphatase MutT (NUDIX family)
VSGLPPHPALVERLGARLAAPLPGHDAQLAMAPLRGRPRESLSVEGKNCREAAVLVLLYPFEGATALALTARQPALRDHSGQVSLPGGSLDPGETPEAAALREGWEEVGVPADRPAVLGRLTPLYIPPSNFCVQPVVAALDVGFAFRPHEAEVAAMLDVPLAALLDPAVRRAEPWEHRGATVEVPFFLLGDHKVWGATAMILAELAALLEEVGGRG